MTDPIITTPYVATPPTPVVPHPTLDQILHPNLAIDYKTEELVNYTALLDALQGGNGRGGGSGVSRKRQIANLAAELSDRSKQLGLTLTDTEIAELAKEAVVNKWSETVINDKLLISVDWQKVTGGDLTAGVDLIKATGAQYLVPVTDAQAKDLALRMAKGEVTQNGFTSMLQAQARARYSWMSKLIDEGVKPSDYFAPIRNVVAQTLEMTPDAIDLLDSRWMKMLEVRDEKTGQLRAATTHEAMVTARNDPAWAKTGQAQSGMATLARNLAIKMGTSGS